VQQSVWSKQDLIEKSKSILLVKTVASDNEGYFKFEVLDILKGEIPNDLNMKYPSDYKIASNKSYDSRDFDGHTDEKFWLGMWHHVSEGRGDPGYHCYNRVDNHRFILNESYLLFPDALAATASAEIIKTTSDSWYKYVKETISSLTEINGAVTFSGNIIKENNLYINLLPYFESYVGEYIPEYNSEEDLTNFTNNLNRQGYNIINNLNGNNYSFSFTRLPIKYYISVFILSECKNCTYEEREQKMKICLISESPINIKNKKLLNIKINKDAELKYVFDCSYEIS